MKKPDETSFFFANSGKKAAPIHDLLMPVHIMDDGEIYDYMLEKQGEEMAKLTELLRTIDTVRDVDSSQPRA